MPINESSLLVYMLNEDTDITQFHCRIEKIQGFLLELAISFQEELLGATYLIYQDEKLLGFFTISMDSLRIKGMEEEDNIGYEKIEYYPAIKIGQLCVNEENENEGIGSFMLKLICGIGLEFSDKIGCRFLTVNTIPNARTWYEKYGFRPLKYQRRRINLCYYLDLKKLNG